MEIPASHMLCLDFIKQKKQGWQHPLKHKNWGIHKAKTMADKLIYIPNDNTQNL